ncbi:MAG: GntR family transcriptional regulator [Gemmatimonadaceae bacterium]|nr:GntR family transcriptional regulator [Gemmatimonadaceae bacterium]MCW5825584.1 GntR family transcriptional regulator [Gemmatimonadaceae bacterium]
MFSRIDPRSPVPIYAQIADRVRVAIASGELTEGDALPSVRALAGSLRVNPATVVQAYRELEREQIVEMRQGAGTFIAAVGTETKSRERGAAARRLVQQMLAEAARLGLSHNDIQNAVNRELPEEK